MLKPTMQFRWLKFHMNNSYNHPSGDIYGEIGYAKVLQQWWESDSVGVNGEWRDIVMDDRE